MISMLNVYRLEEGRLAELESDSGRTQLNDAHWFELVAPTAEELKAVQAFCLTPLPDSREIEELEASSHHLSSN